MTHRVSSSIYNATVPGRVTYHVNGMVTLGRSRLGSTPKNGLALQRPGSASLLEAKAPVPAWGSILLVIVIWTKPRDPITVFCKVTFIRFLPTHMSCWKEVTLMTAKPRGAVDTFFPFTVRPTAQVLFAIFSGTTVTFLLVFHNFISTPLYYMQLWDVR